MAEVRFEQRNYSVAEGNRTLNVTVILHGNLTVNVTANVTANVTVNVTANVTSQLPQRYILGISSHRNNSRWFFSMEFLKEIYIYLVQECKILD